MSYKVHTTNSGRFALVSSDGRTIHVFHSECAAICAADAMNTGLQPIPANDPFKSGRWVETRPCEGSWRRA